MLAEVAAAESVRTNNRSILYIQIQDPGLWSQWIGSRCQYTLPDPRYHACVVQFMTNIGFSLRCDAVTNSG